MPGTLFTLPEGTTAQAAMDAVGGPLVAAGWRFIPYPPENPGWWMLERGEVGSTILLGGLAGDKLLVRFPLGIVGDEQGRVTVSVHSEGLGRFKGGIIGANRSRDTETQLLALIQGALQAAGLYVDWRTIG